MTRPASISHLVAETLAFPLASPVAYRGRLLDLSRAGPGGEPDECTRGLADALRERLRLRARGLSEELLRQVRDAVWFPAGARETSLHALLHKTAERFLTQRDGRVALRTDALADLDLDGGREDHCTRALRWRWLTLALPADLFVAAVASTWPGDAPNEHIFLASPQLARVLELGCAETHLHVGAAVPFEQFWTGWMIDPPFLKDRAAPFGGGASLQRMLAAAAVARLVMTWFLDGRVGQVGTFAAFLRDALPAFVAASAWHRDPQRFEGWLRDALARVAGRKSALSAAVFVNVITRIEGRRLPARGVDLARFDPLRRWLPAAPGMGLPETRFAARALGYLGHHADDRVFSEVFWQYQRVRVQMYRHLVEEPGTAGLDWFTRNSQRISPLRGALEGARYASALRVQSQGLHLKALEARTSPRAHWTEVRDEIRDLARQALNHNPAVGHDRPEVGLILHFIKHSHHSELPRYRGEGARSYADPAHSSHGMRFSHWFSGRLREAQAIATTLRRHPETLAVLRGIDVANREIATPTWVLAPLFAVVREASAKAARCLACKRSRWGVGDLRVTVHAGEDYRRLMEGLRRMHEAIETGLLRAGDRIGHGLALAYDVDRYAAESPVVFQPREDRLDDLLWELARYRAGDCDVEVARLEFARAEALRLGRVIYGDPSGLTADALLDARRLRHDRMALARLGYPRYESARRPQGEAASLLWRHLSDHAVFARGQEPIEVVVTAGERRALSSAQGFLQRLLARMEITIEANPSSNLLIGDLGGVDAHPVFRLVPLDGSKRHGVSVSVNTDNPVTFGSCLGDEFAHLHHALLALGVGSEDALAWIEAARSAGMRSRFTLAASTQPEVLRAVAR